MARLLAAAVSVAAAMALAQATAASGPWAPRHRPLHLPRLTAGGACPVSHVDRRVDWARINIYGGSGIGRGPVYPGLGDVHGRLVIRAREDNPGPWYREKVFWYVAPSYRGPVLIRGRRLDGHGSLRFGSGTPKREMRISTRSEIAWPGKPPGSRGVPSYVRVHESGCYGVQIDGSTFSRVVVFSASTP